MALNPSRGAVYIYNVFVNSFRLFGINPSCRLVLISNETFDLLFPFKVRRNTCGDWNAEIWNGETCFKISYHF